MKPAPRSSKTSGFTLIEVAIALIVIGLLMVPLLQAYNSYRTNKALQTSTGNIIVIKAALQKYALKYGKYPVPAIPSLSSLDPMYGKEYTGVISACTTNITSVCTTPGFRDVVTPAGNDPVYIGTVPFAALGVPKEYSLDGYGMRLTYAVTASMTSNATFLDANGVIRVIQKDGSNADGINDNAHYVLVSHGNDRVGAITPAGTLFSSCPTTASTADQTNCNHDASFTNNFALFGVGTDAVNRRYSAYGTGVDHYDDFIGYTSSTTSDLWSRAANTSNMFSRAGGNIRIGQGNTAPNAKLMVMGNIKSTALTTNRLCNGSSCATAGTNTALINTNLYPKVFRPTLIADEPLPANAGKTGGGVLCGTNKPMTGISNADEECTYNKLPVSIGDCNSSVTFTYPVGINSAGKLNCQ